MNGEHHLANNHDTLQALKHTGVVAVVRADKAEERVEVARALRQGGVMFIEITMTVPGALMGGNGSGRIER